MKTLRTLLSLLCLTSAYTGRAMAQSAPVVVFTEPGFPAADSPSPSLQQLHTLFPDAQPASEDQLRTLLSSASTRLLVLPYGSAFPESLWSEISGYLRRGGNLLVLGGQPFTRAAFRDASGWHLHDYSVRFTRELGIDQYQGTPGSDGLDFEVNPDVVVTLPRFAWKRAFSPIIRLSTADVSSREGSAGMLDARLDALAWGTKDRRRLAAPALQIDHWRKEGGRWIFLASELAPDFYRTAEARKLVHALAEAALAGSIRFTLRPTLPLYLPGESIELRAQWSLTESSETKSAEAKSPEAKPGAEASTLTAKITLFPESQPAKKIVTTVQLPPSQPIVLAPPQGKGLYVIEAELFAAGQRRAVDRSAFWIRDEDYLRSGPHLTVNRDYFELDGKPLAVVGTTYMASDVQRLFFERPNVYVWDRDLGQISAAGLNMLRSGWWSGWEKLCDSSGQPSEQTLRTLEAYLMTARKHGLPVQFTFFAFLPEVLGGGNAYLDPVAIEKQKRLISTVAARFHDVPFIAWDVINEPSASRHLWQMRPNGDALELERWNLWLKQRYPDRAALAAAWNLPTVPPEGNVPLPTDIEFAPRGVYLGHNSLKLYDYYLFAQESFTSWVDEMRAAIRATGSQQLITVGQDEGGYVSRLAPSFFGKSVDFTSNHSWWENDSLLWDSLAAKQPGKPMLVQETGVQRELTLDEISRRTPESEAALVERKLALSFVQGSGAIQWLWNTNAYMTLANEAAIGALRPDGTEKPEAATLRRFAAFARAIQPDLREPQPPLVAIVTSQAAQFSVLQDLQIQAQRKAVRAAAYNARAPVSIVAENQLANLGSPRLAILPSAQALSEAAWHSLLDYVSAGGNLLMTGPIERDEHWHRVERCARLGMSSNVAEPEPITYRNAELCLRDRTLPLSFDQQKQSWLEALRFKDGNTLQQISHGKGRIFWAAYPIELADGIEPAAELYSYVLEQIGIGALFELKSKLSPGVLVYPTILRDSILYIIVSESATDADIDLVDRLTGARLAFTLSSQHAALVLIRKSNGAIVAKYGFNASQE